MDEKKYKVERICAWCNKKLKDAVWNEPADGRVTHTICEDCRAKTKEEMKNFKESLKKQS